MGYHKAAAGLKEKYDLTDEEKQEILDVFAAEIKDISDAAAIKRAMSSRFPTKIRNSMSS